ncbi:ATPase family associated with various cellular activities (AAA) [Paenimyroides aquimaris]|uniref:ATPase family associated with various cellular activities (AAA) n=1 Tax=Paenimyroides marinum TaxID=1159016 RepID=A0A1H6K1I2_9FLAO|nr:ATP-binding protein [Paenimyroides aquimaris]SEH68676.1 ATPase family associated with various cellular activities (AAA) [Paenimyroides aquimaris]
MKLKDLSDQLNISLESLQNFIYDFNIDLGFCIDEQFNVTEDFHQFTLKNIDFLKKYAEDRSKEKTIADIAKTINVKEEDVLNFFVSNGIPAEVAQNIKTNLSSYLIHLYIGGEYKFIDEAFPETDNYANKRLVGYTDLYFHLNDMLDPFINKDQSTIWGISKPAGIVLYGPPGSGKIFWARKIAQMIGYDFVHVYKDYLAGNLKTNKNSFTHFLNSKMQHPKTLLFIDSLDELLSKKGEQNFFAENIELINTILRHTQKDIHQELLMVGSAEILNLFNDEVLAPGRFDMQIPIFPPNSDERTQLIIYHLTENLVENSPLLEILKKHNALSKTFWEPIAAEMRLFSNTMIIDFTQSLKKRLYALHRKDETKNIELSDKVLRASFNEAKAKLTAEYLKRCAIFLIEAKQSVGQDFPHRVLELEADLESYQAKKVPINKIGFKQENEEKPNTAESTNENDPLDLMV